MRTCSGTEVPGCLSDDSGSLSMHPERERIRFGCHVNFRYRVGDMASG